MRGPIRSVLLGAAAVCAMMALSGGLASAATLKENGAAEGFLAVYGKPAYSATLPIGGGLGRNFGFGENLLFRASTGAGVGTNLAIELEGGAKAEAKDSYIGATLTSNTTGVDIPLSAAIQFVDFQNSILNAAAAPSYTDTTDRPLITEICSPASVAGKCKTDPSFATPVGSVKIDDVTFDLAGNVIQGTVWGKWLNGTATTPACIELEKRPAGSTASQNLIVTQSTVVPVGTPAINLSGKACLISANNNYYKTKAGEEKTPLVEVENK